MADYRGFEGAEEKSHPRVSKVNEPQEAEVPSHPSSTGDTDSLREHSHDIERQTTRRTIRSEKAPGRASQDLRRTASNVLSHVISRMSTRGMPEPPPPPDGGVLAWSQVAAGFLVIFTTWGYVNAFGAFQTYYTETMTVSPSSISWIGSVQVFLTLGLGVFSGRLLDAGYYLPTYIVGAVIQVIATFLMSLSTQYWQLMLTQGVMTGLGNGIFFTPTVALIATYFDKRRALAIGLVTTGNSSGGAIYPVVTRQLLPTLGFAWTTRVLGFMNLACLSVGVIFLRARLPPRKSAPLIDVSALKDRVFLAFCLGLFCMQWANYYTFYYIASFGEQVLGMTFAAASILVIVINGVAVPFRVIIPMVARYVGPLNVLTMLMGAWAVVAFCWLAVKDIPGFYAFTCVYGVLSGSFQSLLPTTVTTITPHLNMAGTRMGMAFGFSSLASLTGPPIGGALQAADGGKFTGAQGWAAGVTFLGFLTLLVARVNKVGWDLRAKA
ncbi:major facilitator superfamily domain-containing protein [Xylariales sp. PMI_506]|nr:major facilitator superfamily domain-containing protein [Xylariales sp. PMI_506]